MDVPCSSCRRRRSAPSAEDEEQVEQQLAEHDRNAQSRQRERTTNEHRAHGERKHPRHGDSEPVGHRPARRDVREQRDESRDRRGN